MKRFIQVILPLRLEWEPVYYADEEQCGLKTGLLSVGMRVRVDLGGKEYVAVVSNCDAAEQAGAIDEAKIKPIISIAEDLERVSEQEIILWRQVADYYLCSVGEVYKAAYPARKVAEEEVKARTEAAKAARFEMEAVKRAERIDRLKVRIAKNKNLAKKAKKAESVEKYEKKAESLEEELRTLEMEGSASSSGQPADDTGPSSAPATLLRLSPEQTEAYSQINGIFGKGKPALLHGVTGSGKTEIYLKLAQEVLRRGLNVLYLVPEIALSRQLEERIEGVFPEDLRVFHSGETMSRRREAASFIRSHSYIVLGTRSSLFLPHRKLGLVIVDEEQDNSYKQDSPAPRYNGRETAIMMARIFGANVILGSATPSLESLYNCSVGRFGLVPLTKRFYDAGDSDVEIIDTIAERKKNGMVGQFSRKLIEHIQDRLRKGQQVVVLRERRAYSPVVQCENCGDIPKCKHCNVTLSLHRRKDGSGKLVCHYCGRVYEYSGICSKCGGALKPLGAGTQKIEDEARELFPEARIARLDSDSAQNRNFEKEVIGSFAKGETDILIGTQIVTKGFDFSGLTLVAVLQADSILGQEDFRADERGLQMLEQFRGRCGRRDEKGLFVIQTSQPCHPVYQAIAGGIEEIDLQAKLLEERKVFGYPPYSRAINVIVKDYSQPRVDFIGPELAQNLSRSGITAGVKVIGPYSPAIDKVSNQNIRLIRVLLPKDRFLVSNKVALAKVVGKFEKCRKYHGHIALDVDPV